MQILITGGAGFIGTKLCQRLLRQGTLATEGGQRQIERITVLDQAPVSLPADPRLVQVVGSASDPEVLQRVCTAETQLVYHLAAVVSMAAELDFDLGYSVNLDGTLALLDRCRALGKVPQFIMASSAAVYGGPMPEAVGEPHALFPQTSYGTQKAIGELLVSDHSRKGFVKGCCLRLPTIVVRPGKPNMAASSFASSLIREPLMGRDFVCPVGPETGISLLSVRRVVDAFVHAPAVPRKALGHTTAVQLPGLQVSVNDMVSALAEVASPKLRSRIRFEPDRKVLDIVAGWPVRFAAERALSLGFRGDDNPHEIIQAFIADELDGVVAE